MGLSIQQRRERSVDSLGKLYAFVIAFALARAVQMLMVDVGSNELLPASGVWSGLPSFIAFVAVLVPFYHGMNRHLDCCYLEREPPETSNGGLLFDVLVFLAEAALLVATANAIGATLLPFIFLGALLTLDAVWSPLSYLVHYRHLRRGILPWAVINFGAVFVGFLIISHQYFSDLSKSLALMLLAVLRSGLDYHFCRDFYFPSALPEPAMAPAPETAAAPPEPAPAHARESVAHRQLGEQFR